MRHIWKQLYRVHCTIYYYIICNEVVMSLLKYLLSVYIYQLPISIKRPLYAYIYIHWEEIREITFTHLRNIRQEP